MAKLEVLVVCDDAKQVVVQCDYLEYQEDGKGALVLFHESAGNAPVPAADAQRGNRQNRGHARVAAVFSADTWLYAVVKETAQAAVPAVGGYPLPAAPTAQDQRYSDHQASADPAAPTAQNQRYSGNPNQGQHAPVGMYPNVGQVSGQPDQRYDVGQPAAYDPRNIDPRTGKPIV